jgi:hypothetical protein
MAAVVAGPHAVSVKCDCRFRPFIGYRVPTPHDRAVRASRDLPVDLHAVRCFCGIWYG